LTLPRRLRIRMLCMPTYEYVCSKCGHEFEKVQSIAAAALATCPEDVCGQKKWGRGKVKRKLSAGAGLLFKGSGFYITDYRSEGYKQAAKKDSEAAKPAASSGGDSKSPSPAKPAAKAETKPTKSKSDT
jgi:putative FmdB family regulatory protein